MRWVKRIAGLLLVCVIGLAALLSFILATYDDDDYRYALVHAINRMTGGRLVIHGAFSVELSLTPSISASDVRFNPAAGAGQARIGTLEIQIELLSLLDKMLRINRLVIDNAAIDLPMTIGDPGASSEMIALVPIVEHASLHEVTIRYRMPGADDSIEMSLRDLNIAPGSTGDLLLIKGAGHFDGYAYRIEGRAGNLDALALPTHSYPLDLTLSFENARWTIAGTLDEPAQGGGMDMHLSVEIADLAKVLRVLRYRVPELGRLTGTARLTGDIHAPVLSRLRMKLIRKNAMSLDASGSVQDLFAGTGTAIRFSGSVDDRAILVWALPADLPPINRLAVTGNLSRSDALWTVGDFHATLSDPEGLSMQINGQTSIASDYNAPQPFRDMNLKLRFASPTTNAARPFIPEVFPEMGAVQFSARLTSPSEKDLALEDIETRIGDGSMQLGIRGRVGKMPVEPNIPNSELDLELSLEADNSQSLRLLFDFSPPEIGPVTMKAHWRGSRMRSTLDRVLVHAGDPNGLMIDVDGEMQLGDVAEPKPVKQFDGGIRLSAATTRALAPLFGDNLPEFGGIDARAVIHGFGQELSLSHVAVKTKRQRPVRLAIEGAVERIRFGNQPISGITLSGHLDTEKTSAFSALLGGPKIPDFGPAKATFNITGSADALALSDVTVTAGLKKGLNVTARGRIGQLNPKSRIRQVNFQLTARAPTLQSLEQLIKQPLPDQGPVEVTARLRDGNGFLTLDNLHLLIGTRAKPIAQATGTIEEDSTIDATGFRGVFHTSTATALSYFLKRAVPDLGPMKVDLTVADSETGFTIQSLNVSGGKPGWLQFDASQAQRVPNRVFQTNLSMKELSVVNPVLETELPSLGPIAISGRMTPGFDPGRFWGDIMLGKTKMSTDLRTSVNAKRRVFSGSIRIPVLYRADFVAEPAGAMHTRESAGADKPLFSRQPLPFDTLRTIDLGLAIDAGAVQGYNKRLGPTHFDITVNQGHLPLRSPGRAGSRDALLISTDIRTGGVPRVVFRISGFHTDLRPVLAGNGGAPQDGELYVSANLSSFGRSPHELASHMNGELGVIMENAEIASAELDLISLNIMRWLFTYTTGQREKVNCAVARFVVKEGIATSDLLFLDTPTLSASGKATVNFASETIDMIVHTQPKKTLLPVGLPLKISGSLWDPETTSIPLDEAVKSYGQLIFQPVKVSRHALRYLLSLVGVETQDEVGTCQQLKAGFSDGPGS